jgi:hypothetical protein
LKENLSCKLSPELLVYTSLTGTNMEAVLNFEVRWDTFNVIEIIASGNYGQKLMAEFCNL